MANTKKHSEGFEKEKIKRVDKKTFSFFTLAFPTILIIVIQTLFPKSLATGLVCVAIGFFQFLLLKRFLDDYYMGESPEY